MIYIPFTYFFVLLVLNFYRTKSFNPGNFLLLIYAFSALMSVLLYNVEFLQYKNVEIRLSSCIVYCGILTVFFLPFLSGKRSKDHRILLPDKNLFMTVSWSLIVINLISIITMVKVVIFVMSTDPAYLRESGGIRNLYSTNFFESVGKWLLGHFSDFYVLLLVFFFYSKAYLRNKPLFNALLLVSSLTTIINGLISGGRTQIIYWTLVFISCFLYFKNAMPHRERKRTLMFSLVMFSLIAVYILSVTIMRFSNAFSGATEYDEVFSLLDYSGQIFLNFNDFFSNFQHKSHTLARVFPFLYDLFSDVNFDLVTYKRSITMDIGVFSTFLGDFYIDMGIAGIAVYTIVFSAAAFFTQRQNIPGTKKFQQILLYFMLFQIPLNGLFYYSLHNKTATISVIGTIIICILFRYAEKDVMEVADKKSS